jgi:hypothetical protein
MQREARGAELETKVAQQKQKELTRPMPAPPLFKRPSMPDHSLEEKG